MVRLVYKAKCLIFYDESGFTGMADTTFMDGWDTDVGSERRKAGINFQKRLGIIAFFDILKPLGILGEETDGGVGLGEDYRFHPLYEMR